MAGTISKSTVKSIQQVKEKLVKKHNQFVKIK